MSGNFSQDKMNSDYASVNQQSGIFAGNDGFAIALSGGNTNDIGTAVAGSKNAVENNFLSNIYGVEKLDDEGKALHKKLEKAGIGGIDELQAQYENCKGDADCRRDIRNEFRKQKNAAGEKIVELYESGQLSEKEFNYLVTVYASKMLEGIIEGEKLSDTGLDWIGDIYKASGLSWTFAGKMNNPYLNAIRSNDIIEKSKAQGMSNEQIQEKILKDGVLGSSIASGDVNGILNLFDNGASKEDIIRFAALAAFGKATNIPSAGKGTSNLQQLSKTEMDNLAKLYNNKNIHPKDFTISVNGKALTTDKNASVGAPVFKGASDSDVMSYFKQLAGIDAMPTAKIIPGKGTVYSVKVTEGPNAGSSITLRDFSNSTSQTNAKWTIDIQNTNINKGNRVEVKFQ